MFSAVPHCAIQEGTLILPLRPRRPRRAAIVLLLIPVVAALAAFAVALRPPSAESSDAQTMHHDMGGMDDAAMARWVHDWYAAHPARSGAVATAGAPVDTFLAINTIFNADHNAATQQDTVHIFAGQSVLWQWVNSSHTTTNGLGSSDPLAGSMWDVPLTSAAPQFVREFDQTGLFPFFCRPHEGFGMKGAVSVAAPADTFLAAGTAFDTDNNPGTQVDTTYIPPGAAIMWRWVSGSHTVTSGTGSADPNVGQLFDVPLNSASPVLTFTFPNVGTFPFFCRPHEGFNMKGVVIVTTQLGVPPRAQVAARLAFVGEPAPNPTRMGVHFQFSLDRPGRVRADVFDVAGQRVAVVLDREVDAGIHPAAWDGRASGGAVARSGIYYLRLSAAGASVTRRIAVAR